MRGYCRQQAVLKALLSPESVGPLQVLTSTQTNDGYYAGVFLKLPSIQNIDHATTSQTRHSLLLLIILVPPSL